MESLSSRTSSSPVRSTEGQPLSPRSLLERSDTRHGHGEGGDEAQPVVDSTKQRFYQTTQFASSEFPSSSMPSLYPLGSLRPTSRRSPPSPSSSSLQPPVPTTNSQTNVPLYSTPPPHCVESFLKYTFVIGCCTLCNCECGLARSTSDTDPCIKCGHLNNEHIAGPSQ